MVGLGQGRPPCISNHHHALPLICYKIEPRIMSLQVWDNACKDCIYSWVLPDMRDETYEATQEVRFHCGTLPMSGSQRVQESE